MSSFKILPKNTIRIADLKDKSKEALAAKYAGGKPYLTLNEAYALYADANNDAMPQSLADVVTFLGGAQHPMDVHHLESYEVLSLPWHVHDWKGDWNIGGFGAGNVRVGAYYNTERPSEPRAAVVLIDLNLVDMAKAERDITGASLVIAPKGFTPEAGSTVPEEAVEVPLTLATQDAYYSYSRTGSGWNPERKFLAVAMDIDDVKKLQNGNQGVEFYVRLETSSGTRYINRDGIPGQNFEISDADLKKFAGQ